MIVEDSLACKLTRGFIMLEVSVIVKNSFQEILSTNSRPSVGQLSAICWPRTGRQLTIPCSEPSILLWLLSTVLALVSDSCPN